MNNGSNSKSVTIEVTDKEVQILSTISLRRVYKNAVYVLEQLDCMGDLSLNDLQQTAIDYLNDTMEIVESIRNKIVESTRTAER